MKRLSTFTFIIILSLQISLCQSQKPITKGYFLSGGSLSFDWNNAKAYEPPTGHQGFISHNTKTIQTNLHLGYFAINHLAVGLNTNIIISSELRTMSYNPAYKSKINNSNIVLGPFIRYSTNLGIFLESSTGIGLSKYRFDNSRSNYKIYSFDIGIGYSAFLSNSVAIEPILKYSFGWHSSNGFDIDHEIINGLTIGLGFQIYFTSIKVSKN